MKTAAALSAFFIVVGNNEARPDDTAATALDRLKLPGIKVNAVERSVDVACEVCLDEGPLELVACTKGTKEHESIVVTDAKAMHIHTALLLLGAKKGNPAMLKKIEDADGERWAEIPPAGGQVDVSFVIEGVERPISEFIVAADASKETFPTHHFVFAGSVLGDPAGGGARPYLADRSGNIVSITTFGDELLCLPGVHSHAKGELLWQVDGTHLPAVGTTVTLRLRPKATSKTETKPKK